MKYPNKQWNWDFISNNPNLTLEIIMKYPNKPWDWDTISQNSNITMEMIESNPDKPWNWGCISFNPNLTMYMIETYPEKPWNWKYIALTLFTKDKELFIQQKCKEHLAAFKIQQYYARAKYIPTYKLCRKLHLKFYNETFS